MAVEVVVRFLLVHHVEEARFGGTTDPGDEQLHRGLHETRARGMLLDGPCCDAEELAAAGFDWVLAEPTEQPGMSIFLRDGEQFFHTYSTFGRGTEQMGGAYGVLDMTALGRQKEWEEPKGRALDDGHKAVPDFST